jgi:uncharacterized membrane protein (DUF106 family)
VEKDQFETTVETTVETSENNALSVNHPAYGMILLGGILGGVLFTAAKLLVKKKKLDELEKIQSPENTEIVTED